MQIKTHIFTLDGCCASAASQIEKTTITGPLGVHCQKIKYLLKVACHMHSVLPLQNLMIAGGDADGGSRDVGHDMELVAERC